MEQKIKGLNWVNPKNKRQADWVIEYALKHLPYVELPSIYSPSSEEKVLKILADIQQHSLLKSEATAYQIGKMRNAWYKKEKRDRKPSTDKFLSIAINANALKKLNTQARKLGSTQREIIELLVSERLDTDNLWLSKFNQCAELQRSLDVANNEINKLQSQLVDAQQKNKRLNNENLKIKTKYDAQVSKAQTSSSSNSTGDLCLTILNETHSDQFKLSREEYNKSQKGKK